MNENNQLISDWIASDQNAFPPFGVIVEEFPKIKWLVTDLSYLKTNPICPVCNNDFVGRKWIIAEKDGIYYHIPCYVEEHRDQRAEA